MATFEKTKTVVTTRCHLKAVSLPFTFNLNGQAVVAGAICEVSASDARNLIARGLAVDATPTEVAAAGENIIVAPSRNETWIDAP